MSKILFIDDIVRPNFGSAMSIKPLVENYIKRYNENLAKDIKIYSIKDGKKYIVHVQIPSEKNSELLKPIFYDVIIEFYPVDKLNETDLTLKSYGIKLYCNSPSWMFDFTYIYAKAGCIPSFVPKKYYSKAALIQPPKKKNPMGLFGIDRVVFTAFYHLEVNTGYRKDRMELIMLKETPFLVLKKIMSQDEKLDQVNYENRKAIEARKAEKKKTKIKQPKEINIINEKDKKLELLRTDLENKMGADMKTNFKNYLENDNMKNNMVTVKGTGNLKNNLKSTLLTKRRK